MSLGVTQTANGGHINQMVLGYPLTLRLWLTQWMVTLDGLTDHSLLQHTISHFFVVVKRARGMNGKSHHFTSNYRKVLGPCRGFSIRRTAR
jgi:hypothetical protein